MEIDPIELKGKKILDAYYVKDKEVGDRDLVIELDNQIIRVVMVYSEDEITGRDIACDIRITKNLF